MPVPALFYPPRPHDQRFGREVVGLEEESCQAMGLGLQNFVRTADIACVPIHVRLFVPLFFLQGIA